MHHTSYQPSFSQQSFAQQAMPQHRPGQQVPSQYQGYRKPFQPAGPVQSFYQPPQRTQFGRQNPNAFHAPHYRGNRPNHDAPLRADSMQPSQSFGQMGGLGFFPQQNPMAFASQRNF